MSQVLVPQQAQVPSQQRNLGQLIANLGPQSQLAAQSQVDPRALAAGIKPAFASLTFKGKVWGIRHRGVTQQLLARDPQSGAIVGAIPTVDIVIVKSATAISKNFYIEKYKEGDFNQPDCWSTNGQVPDPAAPKKQSPTCRGCKWDAFGSRTMDDGRKGKACSDNKRIAIVPATDLKNEAYGGPMLLKLPPSSFGGLSELEQHLHMQGYHYYAIKMRLSFDHEAAFPKVIFTPFGVLNDYEMQEVINLQQLDVVDRILSEELYEVAADPNQPTAEQATPEQPTPEQAQPAVQPTQAFQPSAPPTPTPTPAIAVPTGGFGQPIPDPGPIPPFLRGPSPTNGAAPPPPTPLASPPVQVPAQPAPETAEQRIARLEAELAAAKAPPAPPPETAEQKIARLEAELAASKTAPARAPRKRSAPVTPTGPQPAVVVQPPAAAAAAQVALPFTAAATQPVAQTTAPETDEDVGDMPADLDNRVDALLGNAGTSPTS